jgi:4,5-dihydroxyphthalate decarboxylase
LITLSTGFGPQPMTLPILDGTVQPEGIRLMPTAVEGSELFWRQLKFQDFDVSEMSMSSLTIATSKGQREWVGLPIFSMRRFFQTWILVRADAGIEQPADLRGKRVGVPEYQQTAALWARGILSDEFGVQPEDLLWFMERTPDKSHGGATGFAPPPGVRFEYIPETTNIGEMMLDGTLDATLLYVPHADVVGRSRADLHASPKIRPLFRDVQAEGARYFAKTGIYPINHCFVVRRSIAEADPSIPRRIYDAFVRSKELALQRRRTLLDPLLDTGIASDGVANAVDADVMAYGVKGARKVLETVTRYVHEQGLSSRRVGLEEIFAAGTMDT